MSVFTTEPPSYDEVLAARAAGVALVTDFLRHGDVGGAGGGATPTRGRPTAPETTRSCLHVVLEEEWEHLRFAVRDLDAVERQRASERDPAEP